MNDISFLTEADGSFLILLIVLMIWVTVWKGLALWKAAQLHHTWWFIAMLLINTIGILEILYIYFFSKRMERSEDAATEDAEEEVE